MERVRRWLLHIMHEEGWDLARGRGRVEPEDGVVFVHCAYADQLSGVVARHVPSPDRHLIIVIDRQQLDVPVVEENLDRGRALYPHVYGAIPLAAVVAVHPLVLHPDGQVARPTLP